MEDILLATTIIGAIVAGVTQMVKQTEVNRKLLPWINVLVGIIIGFIWAMSFEPSQVMVFAWAGALSGLGAGGFYDVVSNTGGLVNEGKSNTYINDGSGLQDTRGDDE